ncbi:MAG: redoxin domain-containing protein [Planctomycetota bacterium]
MLTAGLLWLLCVPQAQGAELGGMKVVYRLTATGEVTGPEEESQSTTEFEITLYSVGLRGGDQKIIVVIAGDRDGFPKDLPFGSVIIEEGQKIRVELEHPAGRMLSRRLLPLLKETLPRERLQESQEGKERIRVSSLPVSNLIPTHYKTETPAGAEDQIHYRVELGEPTYSDLGILKYEVLDFAQDYLLSKEDHTILRASFRQALKKTYAGKTTLLRSELEAEVVSLAPLTVEQSRAIQAQYKLLMPIAYQAFPGASKAKGATPAEQLASFQGKFPDSVFNDAVPWLLEVLREKQELDQSRDPNRKPTLLLREMAPDFTLKNLQGESVALSEFKGKPVLLFFWSST